MYINFFFRNLTLILFGLSWSDKGASENAPCIRKSSSWFNNDVYAQQCSDNYQGVKINIFECGDSTDYEKYLTNLYYRRKWTTKQDFVFVFNLYASGDCTPGLIQRFDWYLKLSKQRNANMVAVFTLQDKMKWYNPSNDDEKIHKDLWLIQFSKTLSSKVQENNIKCIVFKHGHTFQLPGNRKELLNLCGLNIF